MRQKYEVEGLDCVQIGRIVGRDPKSVWSWLRGHGIETRKRGHNARVHFKKGHSARVGVHHSHETRRKLREIAIADGRRPWGKNGPHWTGKTGSQHPAWRGGHTPERIAFYHTKEWKSAKQIVLKRAKFRCERCRERARMHIHHVVSFRVKALRAEPSNLVALCKPCHLFVHSKRNVHREFLKESA